MSYAKFKFKNTHPHLSKSLVPFIRRVFLIKRLCSIPASHYCDKPLTKLRLSLSFLYLEKTIEHDFTTDIFIFHLISHCSNEFADIYFENLNNLIDYPINGTLFISNSHNYDHVDFDGDIINFENNPIDYFGIMVPLNLQQIKTTELTGTFLLSNTYFKYDTKLIGFEYWANYASQKIYVEIKRENYLLHDRISLYTKKGYNRYTLPNSLSVDKGFSIEIKVNYPHLLAINDRNDLIYPDMYWNGNEYVKLNHFKNWAFYFNCKIDQRYFLQAYQFSKKFELNETDNIARYVSKKFHLNVRFNKTNFQVKKYFTISNRVKGLIRRNLMKFLVIDMIIGIQNLILNSFFRQFGDLICTKTLIDKPGLNFEYNCSVLLISQSKSLPIAIQFINCHKEVFYINGNKQDGFGYYSDFNSIESNLTSPSNFLSSQTLDNSWQIHLLLTSTEFLIESLLIGFQFFSTSTDQIKINLWSSNMCSVESCSSYFSKSLLFSAVRIATWTIEPEIGKNKHMLPVSIFVNFKSFFTIELMTRTHILSEITDQYFYPDYEIQGRKLTPILGKQILFKALTKTFFYKSIIQLDHSKNYDFENKILMPGTEKNFDSTRNMSIEVMNLEFVDLEMKFDIQVYSQKNFTHVLIDYGDCSNESFYSDSKQFTSYFGLNLDLYKFSNIKFEDESVNSFLVLNSEFRYDTNLLGFKIYAVKEGHILLQYIFVSTDECGVLMPCSFYFKQNISINRLNNETNVIKLNLKKGLQVYKLSSPIYIREGAILMVTHKRGQIGSFYNEDSGNTMSDYFVEFFNQTLQNISLVKLDQMLGINCLIEYGYYIHQIKVVKKYYLFVPYNIKVKLANSTKNINIKINVNHDPSFDITILISNSKIIENSLFLPYFLI
ncbi:hypothetical protein BpHYR1_030347 [Brachionus plicatilis]|uniref:Uncharacterized protein n=1 Tax=Brachionus plicatilis TaxID=10195 RepID=A0A3M7RBR6_BRAPC|nr:hypothetical protein BpHYR1_030347 [Brachionus plicatilis]